MRIAFLGDVNGRAGRHVLASQLPRLVARRSIDFVVANVENAADGFGITPDLSEELLALGIDCMTSGNHIWDKIEIVEYLPGQPRLLRPLNYPDRAPGHGVFVGETAAGVPVAVINLMGRVFMPPCENPFPIVDEALRRLEGKARVILVDMHAEATSEKSAMGRYLDGRVTAVVGTHTHVQTADETILPGGTGYITDLGMTGAYDSVIGIDTDLALRKFLTGMPVRFTTAKRDPRMCGVVVEADDRSGRALTIERIQIGPDGETGKADDARPV
jgi:2',3'-cyclic-nucleotide 2'-phosphodiesterase